MFKGIDAFSYTVSLVRLDSSIYQIIFNSMIIVFVETISFQYASSLAQHLQPTSQLGTHKVLSDVVKVLAVLLKRLLKQIGLGSRPLLHLVPAQYGSSGGDQRADGF